MLPIIDDYRRGGELGMAAENWEDKKERNFI